MVLPIPTSICIQTPVNTLPREATVSTLIQHSIWNVDLIQHVFNPMEAQQICNLPLSHFCLKDKITWCPTRDGTLSIKIACYLEL